MLSPEAKQTPDPGTGVWLRGDHGVLSLPSVGSLPLAHKAQVFSLEVLLYIQLSPRLGKGGHALSGLGASLWTGA